MPNRNYVEAIQAREQELEKMRGEYQLAKAAAAALGCSDHQEALVDLFEILSSFRAGDSGEKAIYMLSQATQLMMRMTRPLRTVRDYERKERTVQDMRTWKAGD